MDPYTHFTSPPPSSHHRLRDTFGLLLCADIVERRLLEVLRFELGSIYTINVYLSFVISNPTRLPTDLAKGELFIGTGCPPDKVSGPPTAACPG